MIHRRAAEDALLSEFLEVLAISVPAPGVQPITLPVGLAAARQEARGIAITTRSVWDLIQIMVSAVEVPDRHVAEGRAVTFPGHCPLGSRLRIHRSDGYPDDASVVIFCRDAWYFIGDTDLATKKAFQLLRALWAVRIADTGMPAQVRPVLTVPVSR